MEETFSPFRLRLLKNSICTRRVIEAALERVFPLRDNRRATWAAATLLLQVALEIASDWHRLRIQMQLPLYTKTSLAMLCPAPSPWPAPFCTTLGTSEESSFRVFPTIYFVCPMVCGKLIRNDIRKGSHGLFVFLSLYNHECVPFIFPKIWPSFWVRTCILKVGVSCLRPMYYKVLSCSHGAIFIRDALVPVSS